jgi:hypothetical protein
VKSPKKLLPPNEVSDWIDRAAMFALQGILSSDVEGVISAKNAAKAAYNHAEALWQERNTRKDDQ